MTLSEKPGSALAGLGSVVAVSLGVEARASLKIGARGLHGISDAQDTGREDA